MADQSIYADIPCPKCDRRGSAVIDSRGTMRGYIRRRRKCIGCGARFSTREVPDDVAAERAAITTKLVAIGKMLDAIKDTIDHGL